MIPCDTRIPMHTEVGTVKRVVCSLAIFLCLSFSTAAIALENETEMTGGFVSIGLENEPGTAVQESSPEQSTGGSESTGSSSAVTGESDATEWHSDSTSELSSDLGAGELEISTDKGASQAGSGSTSTTSGSGGTAGTSTDVESSKRDASTSANKVDRDEAGQNASKKSLSASIIGLVITVVASAVVAAVVMKKKREQQRSSHPKHWQA